MTANGEEGFFWGDENILELDKGNDCAHCKCTKCHQIIRFK